MDKKMFVAIRIHIVLSFTLLLYFLFRYRNLKISVILSRPTSLTEEELFSFAGLNDISPDTPRPDAIAIAWKAARKVIAHQLMGNEVIIRSENCAYNSFDYTSFVLRLYIITSAEKERNHFWSALWSLH